MNTLPQAFLERMARQLGNGLPGFLRAMEESPVRGIRMNPEKPFEGMEQCIPSERVPWCGDGYILPEKSMAGATVFHEAGAFYLQEPSAMLPAEVMDIKPGERILDLCSAPGGKASQMALKMKGKGFIVCNEPVPKRAAVLSRNMERMGVTNSIVTCCYPEKMPNSWKEIFDGVLADVPCSGEGMFRRDPVTRSEWTPEKASGCAVRQLGILRCAAEMVRPGGRLVYSTCTYNPEENEGTVERFLEEHPDFYPESFSLPEADGKNGTMLCMPHLIRGEGQFTAKLRKRGNADTEVTAYVPFEKPGRDETGLFRELFPGLPVPNAKAGNTLIFCPECPELKNVRVLRAGLHLAESRGKILVPDHAAAVSCMDPEMIKTVLSPDEVQRYFAGQEIPGSTDGWTVMSYRNLRLGWGKGSGGKIKNHYPKGLRRDNILTETDFCHA